MTISESVASFGDYFRVRGESSVETKRLQNLLFILSLLSIGIDKIPLIIILSSFLGLPSFFFGFGSDINGFILFHNLADIL